MYQGLRLAVVVPAFNEEHKLAAVLAGLPAYIDHVLVVDDGSADGTAAVALAVASGRPGLEVLRHARNLGVGAAVATGYRRALALGCDAALVMAGDGQMDPRDVPRLLAPIREGRADYVKGNRFACREVWRAMPATRLCGNIALSLLTRLSSGYRDVFDSQCGFTAATRGALLAVDLHALFPRYGYPNDLLARLWVAGARVVDVPVRPIYGPAWRSGISLRTALYPVLFVVLRSLLWRLRARRRLSPTQLSRPAPQQAVQPVPTAQAVQSERPRSDRADRPDRPDRADLAERALDPAVERKAALS
jgi:glycosyltransferase involved in cell wall biosynthesis